MYTPTNLLSTETWVLLFSVIGLSWCYVMQKWKYFEKLGIPYVKPSLTKLGSLRDVWDRKKILEIDLKHKKKYGNVYGHFSFVSPSLMVHDPQMLKNIYIKEFSSFPIRQKTLKHALGKELSRALNVADGHDWKRMRSSTSPSFSASKMKRMIVHLKECTEFAISETQRISEDKDGVFNPKQIFDRLILDMLLAVSFSRTINLPYDQAQSETLKNAKRLFGNKIFFIKFIILNAIPFLQSLAGKFNYTIMDKNAISYFSKLGTQQMVERKSTPVQKSRVDLMQMMLDAQKSESEIEESTCKGLTKEEILGNAMIFLIAGFENVSTSLYFFCYNLAQYPEVQEKIQKEIDQVYEEKGKLDYEEICSMKYLDQCLNESLRLYCPVVRLSRWCVKEVTIGGINFKPGMKIDIPTFALAHDPQYWDQPYEFKPERMDDMTKIDPVIYHPFGAGPRHCVAMRLARLEIKVAVVNLLKQFNILPSKDTPAPPLKLILASSVKPVQDFSLKLKKRT